MNRFLLIFIFISFLGLRTGYAQESTSITLSVKEAPLSHVLKEIQEQCGYRFIYTANQVANIYVHDLYITKGVLSEVLSALFNQLTLTYKIIGIYIVLKKKPAPTTKALQANNFKWPTQVQGSILTEEGYPVPGVTVTVKSTGLTTTTDENSDFTLARVDSRIWTQTGSWIGMNNR